MNDTYVAMSLLEQHVPLELLIDLTLGVDPSEVRAAEGRLSALSLEASA